MNSTINPALEEEGEENVSSSSITMTTTTSSNNNNNSKTVVVTTSSSNSSNSSSSSDEETKGTISNNDIDSTNNKEEVSSSTNSFQLRPPTQFNSINKFLKPPKITITTTECSASPSSSSTSSFLRPSKLLPPQQQQQQREEQREQQQEQIIKDKQNKEVTFVPLTTNVLNDESLIKNGNHKSNQGSSSEFLFGQNLSERGVVVDEEQKKEEQVVNNKKRKLDDVVVVTTGEENEENVLQINCRLYSFENGSWLERVSRGILRLNDLDEHNSRLIVRTQGSLRLMLNTKLWNGMIVERTADKSIKFTGLDESVKIFLVMATSNEMDILEAALKTRLNYFKKPKNCE